MSNEKYNTLAFDFGASSGRAIVGSFDGEKIELSEIHRFPNDPVFVGGTMYWDVLMVKIHYNEPVTYTGLKEF